MHTTGERYTRAFHLKYTGDSWKQELDKRRLLSRRRVRRSNGSVSPKECRLGLGSGKGTSVKYFTVQMMISVSKKKRKTVQMMKEWSQRGKGRERLTAKYEPLKQALSFVGLLRGTRYSNNFFHDSRSIFSKRDGCTRHLLPTEFRKWEWCRSIISVFSLLQRFRIYSTSLIWASLLPALMQRLATALWGMTTSNVLLVTRGTANLMGKKVRWSWINKTEKLTTMLLTYRFVNSQKKTYRFVLVCLISSLMLLPCSNDPLALSPLSCGWKFHMYDSHIIIRMQA